MVINRNNIKIITSHPHNKTILKDCGEELPRDAAATATINDIHNNDYVDDDTEKRNNVYIIQLIQIQIWIRMILWNHARDVGWEIVQRAISLTNNDHVAAHNNTDKRKRKKKKRVIAVSSAREGLIDDIRLLTELVPYVIPVSMNLSQWLKYTLTFGFRQRIPDYGSTLFDHFEIELIDESSTNSGLNQTSTTTNDNSLILVLPVPNKDDDDNKQQHNLLNDSPTKQLLAKRHNRQRAYFASLVKEEEGKEMSTQSTTTTTSTVTNTTVSQSTTTTSSTVTKPFTSSTVHDEPNVDKLLFKTSVSLTATASLARTSNPFLKGSARGNYVGSHLGSKLSNITTLFREVKAAPLPAKKKRIPMKTQMVETKKIIDKKKTQNVATAPSTTGGTTTTTTAAVVQRKRKVDDTTLSPIRTPMKTSRSHHHSRGVFPMSTIAETPTHHYQSVIDETPAKSQITARTIRHCRDAIVTETPIPQYNQLQLLRHSIQLQMESPIVAETPLHRLSTRGGGDESGKRYKSSTVFPTNLWRSNNNTSKQQQQQQEQKQNKRLLPSTNLVRRPQQQQQQQQQQMYSPMRDQRSRRSSSSTSNMNH
jgi:hypothetical protein